MCNNICSLCNIVFKLHLKHHLSELYVIFYAVCRKLNALPKSCFPVVLYNSEYLTLKSR